MCYINPPQLRQYEYVYINYHFRPPLHFNLLYRELIISAFHTLYILMITETRMDVTFFKKFTEK